MCCHMDLVVICELRQWEPVSPVILSMAHKDLEIGLYLLVHTLHLAISLRVVGSGGSYLDPKEGSNLTREVGHECRSTVADHFLQKSVVAPDMLQEQLGDSCRVQGGDCGDGMNPLGQAIHHHKDSIVSLGVWEFSDHVYGDHLPVSIRDLVGDQLPHLLHREGLHPFACITSCNELGNVPGQPGPPVVPQHQF